MYPKKILAILLAWIFINSHAFSQQLTLQGQPDSLFPVTNFNNLGPDPYFGLGTCSVFNITQQNGKYFVFGSFTNLTTNHGSALVMDTLTHNINTSQKWKVNGRVLTSIPDGQGGFYIGGNFTKIGDSSRKYLAQIDRFGRPSAWHPIVDSIVNQVSKRNDTLFIAGIFTNFSGQYKPNFAMYSISGDSLQTGGGFGAFSFLMGGITSFLIDKDTIIYGGISYSAYNGTVFTQPIRKYNFRNNVFLPWQIVFTEFYGQIDKLQFNQDSTVLIYAGNYNGVYIRGINKTTGVQQYKILPDGELYDVKVVGNKAYFAGTFERFQPPGGGYTFRHSIAAFDATTGAILPDVIPVTGYVLFIEASGNKIFLSGKFTQVNGTPRENFATVDKNNYSVYPLDLSPSDHLSTISFSGGSVFLGGYFNGIHSVHRNGLAAIDSATNAILPWDPNIYNTSNHGKRMVIRGDTIFLLAVTKLSNCIPNDYNTSFMMFSVSTGASIYPGTGFLSGEVNDFLINGNYFYASVDRQVRRFTLPGFTLDPAWGVNYTGYGFDHTPTWLLMKGDTLCSVGDNRFIQPCTALPTRKGWIIKYDPNNGIPIRYYGYREADSLYTQPVFEHALISGNKIFVQGIFRTLNGSGRMNFVCINIDDGSINTWSPAISTAPDNQNLGNTSALKIFNGKLWFGGSTQLALSNGTYFTGFNAIDTATGNFEMPPLINIRHFDNYTISYPGGDISDYILNNSELVLAGSYDTINNFGRNNLIRYKVQNTGSGGRTFTFNGNGNWSDAANWSNNTVPPATLPIGDTIIIAPVIGGQCILNVSQTIEQGASITVSTGRNLVVAGNLNIIE